MAVDNPLSSESNNKTTPDNIENSLKQLHKKINTQTDTLTNYKKFYELHKKQGTEQEALTELEKTLKKFPQKQKLYSFLGNLYEAKQYYDKAIHIYEIGRKESPDKKSEKNYEEKLIQIYLSSRHYNEICIASWIDEKNLKILVNKAIANEDQKPIFLSFLSRLKKFPHEIFTHQSLLSIATKEISLAISLNKILDQLIADHYHTYFIDTLFALGKLFHQHHAYLSCLLTSVEQALTLHEKEEELFIKTENFFKENNLSKEGLDIAKPLFEKIKSTSLPIHILCANLLIDLNQIKQAHSLLQESMTFFSQDIRLVSIYTDLLIISGQETKALNLIQKYPLILTLNINQLIRWYHLYLKRGLYFDTYFIYLKVKQKHPDHISQLEQINQVIEKVNFQRSKSSNNLQQVQTPQYSNYHLLHKKTVNYRDLTLSYVQSLNNQDYKLNLYCFRQLKKNTQKLLKRRALIPILEVADTQLLFELYKKNCENYLYLIQFCIEHNKLSQAFILAQEAIRRFPRNKEIALLFVHVSESLRYAPTEYKKIWKTFSKQVDFCLSCTETLHHLKRIDKALYLLKKFILKNPFHKETYLKANHIALTYHRRSLLKWFVEKGIEAFPNNEILLSWYFQFYKEEKKPEKALIALKRMTQLFADKKEYSHHYLNTLWDLKEYKTIFNFTKKTIKDKKEDPIILLIHGKVYYLYHKYNQSIFYLKKSLKQQPENFEAAYYLFLCYCEAQDFSNALKFCPHKVASILKLFQILKRSNEWQHAKDLSNKALSLFPDNEVILNEASFIFHKNNLNKHAEKCLLRLIRSFPKNKEYHQKILDFYIQTKQFSKATILAQKGLEKWNKDPIFLKKLSDTLYQKKDFKTLSDIYLKRLEIDPYNQNLYKTTVLSLYKSKQFEEALQICLKGLNSFAYFIPLYRYASKICFRLKNYKKGIEVLSKGLSYEDQQTWIFKDISQFYLHLGKRTESIYHARMALQIEPDNPDSYRFFAQVYMYFEEYDNASSLLKGAIEKWPTTHILNELLLNAHIQDSQVDELENFYTQLTEDGKGTDSIYIYLFYTQYVLNKKKSAEITLKEAKSIYTKNYLIQLILGAFYYEQGKVKEAATSFENSLSIAPNKKEAYAILYILYLKATQTDKAMVIYKKAQIKFPGSQNYFAQLYKISSYSRYDEWTYHFILKFINSGRLNKRGKEIKLPRAGLEPA